MISITGIWWYDLGVKKKSSQVKRILFVVYELPPIGGGVATAAFNLLSEFSKNSSLFVDVITSGTEDRFKKNYFSKNVTIYSVPIGKKTADKYKKQTPIEMALFSFWSFWIALFLVFNDHYIVAHYFGYPGAFNGYLLRWKVPYIISLRGVDVPGYNKAFGIYYRFFSFLARISWKNARVVVANSQWLKKLALKQLVSADIKVIPNGVDLKMFKPLALVDRHSYLTVTAGGTLMNSKKNIDVLIKGFKLFNIKHPKSHLVLFGDGPEKQKLQNLVNSLNLTKTVFFRGVLKSSELAKDLAKCHIFILPSQAEGMSNALLEAAACGLNIVVSSTSGGVVKDAFILNEVSPGEICRAITNFSNKNKEYTLSNRKSLLSWKEIARYYTNLYDNSSW